MAHDVLVLVASGFLLFAAFHGVVHALLLCARLLRFLRQEVKRVLKELEEEWRKW
jgi:hypothetical protein